MNATFIDLSAKNDNDHVNVTEISRRPSEKYERYTIAEGKEDREKTDKKGRRKRKKKKKPEVLDGYL